MLLLFQLFLDHYHTTSERFKKVLKKVETVDSIISGELQSVIKSDCDNAIANSQSSPKTSILSTVKATSQKNSQNKPKGHNLAQLSQALHQARMELVELARRSEFESQVRKILQGDLKEEEQLIGRVNVYCAMSKSHELDIQVLPQRISSQTTVLNGLIRGVSMVRYGTLVWTKLEL